jgi:hypothetical protein
LGYAELGEIKRERKGSDANANGQDDYEYQERLVGEINSQQETQGLKSHVQNAPDRRRSEPMLYRSMELKSGRAPTMKSMTSNVSDYRDTTGFSDEGPSPLGKLSRLGAVVIRNLTGADDSPRLPVHTGNSHRVPYFRYFGPTAIVPGFKQMVVSVREHRRSTGAASSIASMSLTILSLFQG